MAKKAEPETVLIARFSALGDVAMTIPAVYGACAANPAAKFVVITKKLPSSLFLHRPPNLTVETVDFKNYKGLSGLRRLYRDLKRKYAFDAFVDLHDVLRTKVLRLFARIDGIPTAKLDKARSARHALTRSRRKVMKPLVPVVRRYCEAFGGVRVNVASSFNSLFPSGKADVSLFEAVSRPKPQCAEWIAVAPFAAHKGKVYPPLLMKQLVVELASRQNATIFMFGAGEKESNAIESMAAGLENTVNMARLSAGMEAELALMSNCDVMVAMDSANMHMASLVGLPTVSIWGATHPYAGFYGFRQNPENAVQLDMECRPCSVFGNKPCAKGDYPCLNGISPREIAGRVDAILKNKRP